MLKYSRNKEKSLLTEVIFIDEDSCVKLDTIIENIGTLSLGITGQGCVFLAIGCRGGLQCYKNSDIKYETDLRIPTPPPGCDFIDSVDDALSLAYTDIFPNPASDILQVVLPDSGRYDYTITDMSGSILLNGKTGHVSQINLDISILELGMYLMNMYKGEQSYVAKFVVGK